MKKGTSRRKFLRRSLVCAGIPAALGFGSMRWEGSRTMVCRLDVPLKGLTGPVRLLHMTDLHYSPLLGLGLRHLAQAVEMAVAEKPDVIVLTGDYITGKCSDPDGYAAVLAPLAKAAPTFASFGNHDGGRWVFQFAGGYADLKVVGGILQEAGIVPLVNRIETFTGAGGKLELVGLGDSMAGNFCPNAAFSPPGAKECPRVVLSHNPYTLSALTGFAWDLMLSGHTHGGQILLPLIGCPWIRDARFLGGLHLVDGRWLHVSRGVGGFLGARLNCPPEMTVLQLKGA